MIVTLGNGQMIPLHWNDRFYEGNCPECNSDIWDTTPTLWHKALIKHYEIMGH